MKKPNIRSYQAKNLEIKYEISNYEKTKGDKTEV